MLGRSAVGCLLFAGKTLASCQNEYEYVVVGSGPGGGSLAANLARAGHSVFLIEAGGDNSKSRAENIPAVSGVNAESVEASWSFFVSHFKNDTQARRDDKFTYRLNNGSFYTGLEPPEGAQPLGIYYPRGATLGGSAQVNAMNMALPPDSEWQMIADLTGDDSWLPKNMHRYFEELEKNVYLPAGTPAHGFKGFLPVNVNNISYITTRETVSNVAVEAIRRLQGIKVSSSEQLTKILQRDINSGEPGLYSKQGVFQIPRHIDDRRRRSSARDYILETASARAQNGSQPYPLTVSLHSLATRILFRDFENENSTKPEAYGVEYLKGKGMYAGDRRYNASDPGQLRRVTATREVIIAGGAFNSPQLLMLSGVGPRKDLEALDIPVVVDLPAVGNYLQDNYEGGVSIRAAQDFAESPAAMCTWSFLGTPAQDPCLAQWEAGYGAYGEAPGSLGMWFRSSVSESAEADIFFFGAPNSEFRGYWPGYSQNRVPQTAFFWSMVKMQVGNQAGTVKLRSKNPRDVPLIDFNFFDQNGEKDLQALTEGAKFAFDVFDAVGAPITPYTVVEPPPHVDSVKQGLMDNVFSHHASSTCRMGRAGDKDSCVDSRFRVNGVDGLRVVDASIFPRTPGGFAVAPTYVISQKAFHTLMEDLGRE